MATRAKAKASALYERDVYAWAEQQAVLLRARQFGDLDLEHLIEEIEDVGTACTARSARAWALLKLEDSAAAEPRAGWERTIRARRADLAEDLTSSLWPRIEASLDRFYETARTEAAIGLRTHGEQAAADALPATCPYALDRITGDWLP